MQLSFDTKENMKSKAGRPASKTKDNKSVSSVEKGTKPGEKRKTYIVNIDLADKINQIAQYDKKQVKEVVDEAFKDMVAKYEARYRNR